MSNIAELVAIDQSVRNRCFFYGTTVLGGSDACTPEINEAGEIILRSLNTINTAYRVTEAEYLELRKYPKRKVGIWEFVSEDDEDADYIASATRYPQSAGRRIGSLERELSDKSAQIVVLTERLQAIIDWCDIAMKNADEFDSHGVRNLDGPIFDAARAVLAAAE